LQLTAEYCDERSQTLTFKDGMSLDDPSAAKQPQTTSTASVAATSHPTAAAAPPVGPPPPASTPLQPAVVDGGAKKRTPNFTPQEDQKILEVCHTNRILAEQQ